MPAGPPIEVKEAATRCAAGLDGPRSRGKDDQMSETTTDLTDVDPVISEAVENISNRFGAQGLCDLIALAREELARAEAALRDLGDTE
jgi:hypothetical protein